MWWQALLAAFGLIFVAELGDKTQLIILTLSAKCGFKQVFLGAAAAFALLNALAVSVGVLLYEFVPDNVIKYTVSGVFILFGILMLLPERKKAECEEEGGDGEEGAGKSHGPLLTAFLLVCLMELGDKTQLSLLALTAEYSQPLFIFIGGTLALWATSLIGALVGMRLGKYIPQVWMRRISGVIFIAFGVINLFW
jgi:putative Ca2+/H+ antiporter (TMEM165/GDT1 family)